MLDLFSCLVWIICGFPYSVHACTKKHKSSRMLTLKTRTHEETEDYNIFDTDFMKHFTFSRI